jgi:hypothetical protein
MKIEWEIDLIKTGKFLFFVGLIILALVAAMFVAITVVSGMIDANNAIHEHNNELYQSGYAAGVASVPTATPTPIPTAVVYPYGITYQVQSTSTTGGLLQVFTTDGKTLVMPDYNAWDNQIPRAFYSASIISKDSDGRLHVDDVFYVGGNMRVYGNDYWDRYPQDYYYKNSNGRVECAGNMVCG